MSGWGAIYNNTSIALAKLSSRIATLQEQAASGKRVLRASDDPGAAYRILDLKQEARNTQAYMDNLQTVVSGLSSADTTLQDICGHLSRANTLLTQATTATYAADQRKAMAEAIDGILEDVVSLANHQIMGKYVFAGAAVGEAPYQATRSGRRIVDVTYQGSRNDLTVPVAPGVQYYGTLVGDRVFQSNEREAPVFLGGTGAAAGSGTSSARGDIWLSMTHDTTEYLDGGTTGIAPGASSAAGDTILGTVHSVTIDADNNTIRLDNGQARSYGAASTDLKLTNEDGDVAYVDASGITLGAGQQTVSIKANAKATIDDGASYVDVTSFADNLKVTQSGSGRVLYVNATQLARTGTDVIRIPGTYDVFGTLITMRDLMLNEGDMPESRQLELLGEAGESLKEVMGGVTQNMTAVGSRLQALDSLNASLDNFLYNANAESAALGDVDVAQLAVDLARSQTYYQMTLMSVSKLLSLSLLDFL